MFQNPSLKSIWINYHVYIRANEKVKLYALHTYGIIKKSISAVTQMNFKPSIKTFVLNTWKSNFI